VESLGPENAINSP